MRFTRREVFGATAGALAAGPAAAATPRNEPSKRAALLLSEIFVPGDPKLAVARQVGANHVILGASSLLSKVPRDRYLETLEQAKADFAAIGMQIVGVESHPVPAEKIKLGQDGRDEEIENYQAAIVALGKADIRMVCYNFMAGLGWYRTRTDLPERGGALTSEFDNAVARQQGLTQWGEIPEEKIWANMEYFQKAIIPVAERAGVNMALHPDDPPLSPLRGIGRIVTSAANYRRIMNMVPSRVNGVTFCQANFVLMGEDIYALAGEWVRQNKIFFVHFRDVAGNKEKFHETFHDNGPTDMVRMLQIYGQSGLELPIRPDHAPTLAGEANDHPGYAFGGKVFAFGFMAAAMKAKGVQYR
jgi:mannonate dehydratase